MELKEEIRINAPRDKVFAAINDAEILQQSIPGCEVMERVSDKQVNFETRNNGQLAFEGAIYFDSNGRILRQIQVVVKKSVHDVVLLLVA